MKVAGKSSVKRNMEVVEFKRGDELVKFIVTSLPMGWDERMRILGLYNYPNPPKKVVTDKSGKVVRGADRNAVVEDDRRDPQYIKECSDITRRLRAVKLAFHLELDGDVQFDAVKPTNDNSAEWLEYGDSLVKELFDFGLTDDEITYLITKGDELATVLNVDKDIDDFLKNDK